MKKALDENDKLRAGMLPRDPIEGTKLVSLPPGLFALTDLGNAERLLVAQRGRLRYCPQRRKFLTFSGNRWIWDETGQVVRWAKASVRQIYAEAAACKDDNLRAEIVRHARRSESAARIQAMVTLVQSEEGVPVLLSELDADAYLLNCENGTLNLRTMGLQPHRAEDLITKTTGINYDKRATSVLWEGVLDQATGGDAELARYLQRVAGYALIGEPLERRFFFLHGPPGTAKSTIVEALHSALGDYAQSAGFETWLMQSNIGGNRGDLVRLAGARLVTSVEVSNGARWDEALIKRVTGGDEIVAAAKFEGEVSFKASFTLLLAANDAPSAREDDAGLWARMRRIPLIAQIPIEKQDPQVKVRLRDADNATAVLTWAVMGCYGYQEDGFGTCKAVDDSTAEYHAENDHFTEFLSDCCVFERGGRITRKALRECYENWAQETGRRKLLNAREIAAKLKDKATMLTIRGTRTWDGIRTRELTDLQGADEP